MGEKNGKFPIQGKKPKSCTRCKVANRVKRTGQKCRKCALETGYKKCTCGRLYRPTKPRQRTCGKHVVKSRSVWAIASAGLPTLGKRK
jgi:hypothetical protein